MPTPSRKPSDRWIVWVVAVVMIVAYVVYRLVNAPLREG